MQTLNRFHKTDAFFIDTIQIVDMFGTVFLL